jgi:hypothetical protein
VNTWLHLVGTALIHLFLHSQVKTWACYRLENVLGVWDTSKENDSAYAL